MPSPPFQATSPSTYTNRRTHALCPGTAGEIEGEGATPGLIWEGGWDGESPGLTFLSHPRYKAVWLIFFMLGLGTLLPWNFFMTATAVRCGDGLPGACPLGT